MAVLGSKEIGAQIQAFTCIPVSKELKPFRVFMFWFKAIEAQLLRLPRRTEHGKEIGIIRKRDACMHSVR